MRRVMTLRRVSTTDGGMTAAILLQKLSSWLLDSLSFFFSFI